jgi:membrane protein required for beta-lactamase induction
MSLVAILLSLALIKLLPVLDHWRSTAWFHTYRQWMQSRLGNRLPSLALLLVTLAIPVAIVALLQAWATHWLAYFALSLGILLYSFGPRDTHRAIRQFVDAKDRQDETTAHEAIAGLVMPEDEDNASTSLRCLVEEIFIQTHERLLAIIFWFIILGPMGALLYQLNAEWVRQSQREENPELRQTLQLLHTILSWIPVRLAALSYAIVGSFVHALQAWNERYHTSTKIPDCECYDIMVRIGLGSLQHHGEAEDEYTLQTVREALGLCTRAFMAWITVLAVLTLAGFTA